MSRELEKINNNETMVDLQKREFMGKFGKYAIVGAGMATLMSANASGSFNSGCRTHKEPRGPQGNNGWGNGDQRSPGGSGPHNNAENNRHGNPHHTQGNANPN